MARIASACDLRVIEVNCLPVRVDVTILAGIPRLEMVQRLACRGRSIMTGGARSRCLCVIKGNLRPARRHMARLAIVGRR